VTSGRWRPALLLGALVAGLLAMRAAAPFVAPAPSVRASPATAATARPAALAAATRPARLAEATGARLLLGWDDGLLQVDVDAGAARPIPLPGRRFETDRGLVQRDRAVVVVRGGVAYAVTGRPGRPASGLGPASYALASSHLRRVWLVEQTGDPERWFQAREVTVDGARPGRAVAPASRVVTRGSFPLAQRPVAGAPTGLLLEVVGPGGGLAVWEPRTGRLRHRFDAGSPLTAVAASGRRVAWVEGSALRLGDLASGRHRLVAPPPGTDGFAAPGAFSPDGRTLAAVTRGGFSTRPALALIDVERASAARVAGSEGALADRCAPCLAWAPAGDWLFFSRLGPGFGIGAYRLGRPRAVTVPVDVPGSFPPSFATLRPE
jgi:hypothetical protein